MSELFTILIAEKNRHIRAFLRREIRSEGYAIQSVGTEQEMFYALNADFPPDLLVFSIDFPIVSIGLGILEKLESRVPRIPIVVHILFDEFRDHKAIMEADAFVRKRGNPDDLKKAIADVLRKHYGFGHSSQYGKNACVNQKYIRNGKPMEGCD